MQFLNLKKYSRYSNMQMNKAQIIIKEIIKKEATYKGGQN